MSSTEEIEEKILKKREYQKQYYKKWKSKKENMDKIVRHTKKWREKNRERFNENANRYRNRSEEAKQKNRDCAKAYAGANREKISQKRKNKYYSEKGDINLWAKAKTATIRGRAKKAGLAFNLTPEYLLSIFPGDSMCPIMGIKMSIVSGRGDRTAASVDRINPALGYVYGNVAVISFVANAIKQGETDPAIFRNMAAWLERSS